MSPNTKHGAISDFYKEEFLKHRVRLERQRDFYSDPALDDIEMALDKIINEIDSICRVDQFTQIASHLLERIDFIAHLSGSPTNYSQRIQ
jgi:hypothetical protein